MNPRILTTLVAATLLDCGVAAAQPACPPKDEILGIVSSVNPDRASRTTRFHADAPIRLYERAAGNAGEAFAARDGKTVWGVIVTDRPVEAIWKALNDEDHHAIEGDYIPVRHSEVIDGTPRGESRVLFQYFKKAGIGRWWVSRVEMNGELYESSAGTIWELYWQDVLDSVDASQPPMNEVSQKLTAIRESYGAWFIVPLDRGCTLLEYYNYTEPGGFVSVAQGILAKRSVRDTLRGIVRLADEHVPEPHPDAVFVRPDGTPLD